MGEWTLNVGNITVAFRTSKYGTLGIKFNKGKSSPARIEYLVPSESSKTLPVYNPRHPQEDFIDVRYAKDDEGKKYGIDEINKKYYDVTNATVFISPDEMARMYPMTKEAKVISKQPLNKLDLTNIDASGGYYLLPVKEYANIQKYKKVIEWLGNDFAITSPIRLTVRSTETHNYAIYVDRRQNALVAMEVLVKAGRQEEPVI